MKKQYLLISIPAVIILGALFSPLMPVYAETVEEEQMEICDESNGSIEVDTSAVFSERENSVAATITDIPAENSEGLTTIVEDKECVETEERVDIKECAETEECIEIKECIENEECIEAVLTTESNRHLEETISEDGAEHESYEAASETVSDEDELCPEPIVSVESESDEIAHETSEVPEHSSYSESVLMSNETGLMQDASEQDLPCASEPESVEEVIEEISKKLTPANPKTATTSVDKYTGWKTENGKQYWYENGVKQGTTGRGKEIYDPGTNAWYWLDAVQGGAKAVSKDVYMESDAGQYAEQGDGTGKWVRYDKDGHMIKGWQTVDGKTYYFDPIYGSMAHGKTSVEQLPCWFDETTGIGKHLIWEQVDNQNYYWYESGRRQGYDPKDNAYRGKEIYDPGDNAWYWLDNNAQGKKAVSKDVYQPYTYQGIDNIGKWVRYDAEGRMIKGWDCNENGIYYFNDTTGAMTKGTVELAGQKVSFDNQSGIMSSELTPGVFVAAIEKIIRNDMADSGILASLTGAQAYLESAYGTSRLTKEANNLFGIKGFYNGDSITMTTQEYIGGRWITQKDIFRKYPSWKASVSDHSDLFNSLSRYSNLRNLKNYRQACTYVREDGYATDPMYTVKLINIIKRFGLDQWDGSEGVSGYSSSDRDVQVTASALNVRSSASISGSVLTSLPNGMIVVIDRIEGNWGRLADYQNGWICLDYVKYR